MRLQAPHPKRARLVCVQRLRERFNNRASLHGSVRRGEIIIMKNIYLQIKWGFQRMFRGYDDRLKWDFESYFEQFIPALKEFCEEEFENEHLAHGNNPYRGEVFGMTLILINDCKSIANRSRLWEYVGKNIGYYWN